MTDLATTEPSRATPAEVLQGALIDSRQRWRELVDLVADFAFETDEWGRFTLVSPDRALGWLANALVGEPAAALLADTDGFDPFLVTAQVRHRQAWLKRGDGGIACLTFCAAPLLAEDGRVVGARGVGIDRTEPDGEAGRIAVRLRRAEVLDHILHRMGKEVVIPRMMSAVLEAIADVTGAEGAAVVRARTEGAAAAMPYTTGTGVNSVQDTVNGLLRSHAETPAPATAEDGRKVLLAACQTRFGQRAGLAAWRLADARDWDDDDIHLLNAAVNIVRMALEHEATQREMVRQARTDPLTGLLNRRAFLEEMERHAARQERDREPATLMFLDLDNFKPVNDRYGHEAGDDVLRGTANLLRKTFRPTDLVARLGGDEFAIWLNGADHMTAAERAEYLRDAVPRELEAITGPDLPRVGASIGIACREAGDHEPLDSLMRRADHAMYEVKRGGRGHWRVSLLKRQ